MFFTFQMNDELVIGFYAWQYKGIKIRAKPNYVKHFVEIMILIESNVCKTTSNFTFGSKQIIKPQIII